MTKKRLLFVIDSLNVGGAEKSLVTLLNLLDYAVICQENLAMEQVLLLDYFSCHQYFY